MALNVLSIPPSILLPASSLVAVLCYSHLEAPNYPLKTILTAYTAMTSKLTPEFYHSGTLCTRHVPFGQPSQLLSPACPRTLVQTPALPWVSSHLSKRRASVSPRGWANRIRAFIERHVGYSVSR